MSIEKKTKLIYSGELIVIAIIFLVLGILRLLGVLNTNDTFHTVFNWITIFGGTWLTVDFCWAIVSKKRRPKVSLLDKCLNLPCGIFLIIFDIICFTGNSTQDLWKYATAILFIYIFINYSIQGVYHYYHPTPELLKAIEEEEQEKLKEAQEEIEKEPVGKE